MRRLVRFSVHGRDVGRRLDSVVQERAPEYSRSRIQGWIKDGRVLVNGETAKASRVLRAGDAIEMTAGNLAPLRAEPEEIPLDVLYEDEWIVVINKPAGMVVHAGAGVGGGTLVNALLHRFGQLSNIAGELRPGIVHRIDRFTSGALVVAKTDTAHQAMARLFASRKVRKTYLTLVHGSMRGEAGRIDKPIARDPGNRARMTARLASGRAAWTEWRILERFAIGRDTRLSYLEVNLGTGRTHQIRAHMASVRHAVVGDRLYGAPARVADMPDLGRYFLHAWQIGFQHPMSGAGLQIEAPLADELHAWLGALRERDEQYKTAIH